MSDPKATLRERARGLYGQARTTAKEGAIRVRAARLDPPPEQARIQRFGYGLALPAAIARAMLADRALLRRYLWVIGLQFFVTVGVAIGVMLLSLPDAERTLVEGEHAHFVINFGAQAAFWSSLYATLCGVEWVVLALSRDYQSALARDLCLITGIPPEDDEIRPKIRLNFKWMWRKIKARARGFLVFASALPLFSVIAQFGLPGRALSAVLLAVWSIYWAGVFATAKTAHGWTNENSAPDPIYIRSCEQTSLRLPRVIGWIPTTYGRIWRRFTRSMFAPASRFEASPYELTGLALARVLRYVPGIYLLVRPLYGVAAAHVVLAEERRRAAAAGSAQGARIAELTVPVRIEAPTGAASQPTSESTEQEDEAAPTRSLRRDG